MATDYKKRDERWEEIYDEWKKVLDFWLEHKYMNFDQAVQAYKQKNK